MIQEKASDSGRVNNNSIEASFTCNFKCNNLSDYLVQPVLLNQAQLNLSAKLCADKERQQLKLHVCAAFSRRSRDSTIDVVIFMQKPGAHQKIYFFLFFSASCHLIWSVILPPYTHHTHTPTHNKRIREHTQILVVLISLFLPPLFPPYIGAVFPSCGTLLYNERTFKLLNFT